MKKRFSGFYALSLACMTLFSQGSACRSESEKTDAAQTPATPAAAAADENACFSAQPSPYIDTKKFEAIDTKVGTGAEAKSGDHVFVHYSGWLTDCKAFDSSRTRGAPFDFDLGKGSVIKGWDEGVVGMKVGGRRHLIIPSEMGYGSQDAGGGVIPANSVLLFEVELLDVKPAG